MVESEQIKKAEVHPEETAGVEDKHGGAPGPGAGMSPGVLGEAGDRE